MKMIKVPRFGIFYKVMVVVFILVFSALLYLVALNNRYYICKRDYQIWYGVDKWTGKPVLGTQDGVFVDSVKNTEKESISRDETGVNWDSLYDKAEERNKNKNPGNHIVYE